MSDSEKKLDGEYEHVFQNGKSDGEYRMWYIDGTIRTRDFYKNGSREIHRSWHENGQFMEETFYRGEKLVGKWRSYYGNGHPLVQVFYRDGNIDGENRQWEINGCLIEWEFYRDGTCIDSKFTFEKKIIFIRLKNELSRISGSHLSDFLIKDLGSNISINLKCLTFRN